MSSGLNPDMSTGSGYVAPGAQTVKEQHLSDSNPHRGAESKDAASSGETGPACAAAAALGFRRSDCPASFVWSGRDLGAEPPCARLSPLSTGKMKNKMSLKESFFNLDHFPQPSVKIFTPNPFPFLNVCVNQFDLGCNFFFFFIKPVALLSACFTFQFSPSTESSSPPPVYGLNLISSNEWHHHFSLLPQSLKHSLSSASFSICK